MSEPTFGDELRRLREQHGLSLKKFAKLVHYDPGYLSKIENNLKPPTIPLAKACDAVLDTGGSLSTLMPTRLISEQSQPIPQHTVHLPLLIDGRHVLVPLGIESLTEHGQALNVRITNFPGYSSRLQTSLQTKPANAVQAYELYLRGQGLLATNDKQRIEAAITLLDRALDIDPRFVHAQAARGYAVWRQYFAGWRSDLSTLERALGAVDTALSLDPDSVAAHTALIRICWDMGWHERALELGQSIYTKNPDSLDATLAFARALNNGGMAEAALPLTIAVLQIDPTNPTASKLLIWSHVMVGDYSSALETARRYLPTCTKDSNTRWAVALAHFGSGDVNAAIHTARDGVAADPDDITVWNLLGYLYRLKGEEATAREVWSMAIEHVAKQDTGGNRNSLRAQSWLANIEACVGDAERARANITRLLEADPHNGYIKYRITHVLAELGENQAAIRMLREAIRDGFLSMQLLKHEERFATSSLVNRGAYRQVTLELRKKVKWMNDKYTPRT